MSLKKIEQVKADKGFKIWDLIIYGTVIVLTVILFIVFFVTRNTDPLTGIRVTVKAEIVFEYEFGKGVLICSDKVDTEENDTGITLVVHTEGDGVNEIYIDKSAKTVKMSKANCKGKQCTYFSAIKDNSGYVICDPHGLKIEPLIEDLDSPDIII